MSIRLSYSLMKTLLEGCGWQIALERLIGLDGKEHPRSSSGTAYHAALEAHEKARMAGEDLPTLDELVRVAFDAVHEQNPGWPPKVLELSLDEARNAVVNWWSAPIRKGQPGEGGSIRDRVMAWAPISIEQKIILDLPNGKQMSGLADVVYTDEQGRIVVVDHKSATNFGRYPLTGKGLGPQAATYVELVRAEHEWEADHFEYHVARTQQGDSARFERVRVVSLVPTDEDMADLADRIERASSRIDERYFPKAPDWFLCSAEWCPFHVLAGGPCDPYAAPEFQLPQAA